MQLRNRTISPSHANDYRLFREEVDTGLPIRATFFLLHTACDRRGIFEWNLEALHAGIFRFDSFDNMERSLLALVRCGAISVYESSNVRCGLITNFHETQLISGRELPGTLPAPGQETRSISPKKTTRQRQAEPAGVVVAVTPPSAATAPEQVVAPVVTHEPVVSHATQPSLTLDFTEPEPMARFVKLSGHHYRDDSRGRALVCAEGDMSDIQVVMPVIGDADIKEVGITQGYIDMIAEAWPGVDMKLELIRARTWCVTNPSRQKTMRGLPSFLNTWLGNSRRGSNGGGNLPAQVTPIRSQRTESNMGAAMEYLNQSSSMPPFSEMRDVQGEVLNASGFGGR